MRCLPGCTRGLEVVMLVSQACGQMALVRNCELLRLQDSAAATSLITPGAAAAELCKMWLVSMMQAEVRGSYRGHGTWFIYGCFNDLVDTRRRLNIGQITLPSEPNSQPRTTHWMPS